MPRFGDCWKTALAELEHGCGNLDEDVQSRMALGFANCFLQKAGLRNASFNFAHDVFIFFLLASCIHALKDLEVSPFIGYDYITFLLRYNCYLKFRTRVLNLKHVAKLNFFPLSNCGSGV